MILSVPKAILFDWDNTLVESWAVINDALNYTLGTFNKNHWSISETKARARKSLRDSFPEMFGENWEKAAEVFYGRFEEIHISRLETKSGTQNMLEEILELGIFMGIVSNKRGDFLRKEVCHLGWDKYFSSIVGAGDTECDKPSCEPVELALLNCAEKKRNQVWFVGDADIDMECAHNANLTPILLRNSPPEPREFSNYPPAFHVIDCQALSKLIKKM